MKKGPTSGLIEIHAAVLLFGLAGLFGKFLSLPAWTIVLGRTAFATLALGVVLLIKPAPRLPDGMRAVGRFGLMGLVLAVHWITFFHSIQISSVAVGLLSFSTFPVFITWLEPWWFGEKRRLIDGVTSLMVLLGLAVMVYPSPFGGRLFSGVLWGTASGFTFALLSLLNRSWVRSYPPVMIAFYQNSVAALLLLPGLYVSEVAISAIQLGLLALLGIFCTALAHALFIRGLAVVRAQLASIIACLEPVYGIGFAFVLLNEVPSNYTLIGGALIVSTTVVAIRHRAKV